MQIGIAELLFRINNKETLPEGLNISSIFNDHLFKQILTHPLCPKGLKINLAENDEMKNNTIQTIIDILNKENCLHVENLCLNFEDSNINQAPYNIEALIQLLWSGKYPPGLTLNLNNNCLNSEYIKKIFEALGNKNPLGETRRPRLSLILSHNLFYHDAQPIYLTARDIYSTVCAMMTALRSKYFPADSFVDFSYNHINKSEIDFIATAIASGECSPGFSLKIGENLLRELHIIADALESPKIQTPIRQIITGEPDTDSRIQKILVRLNAQYTQTTCSPDSLEHTVPPTNPINSRRVAFIPPYPTGIRIGPFQQEEFATICGLCSNIDPQDPLAYNAKVTTPCSHVFHVECLNKWQSAGRNRNLGDKNPSRHYPKDYNECPSCHVVLFS